jgi:beta-phosphoglucomutase
MSVFSSPRVPRDRCIIFDLDGVLVDTAQIHQRTWEETAEVFEIKRPHGRFPDVRGIPRDRCLDLILDGYSLSRCLRSEVAAEKNRRYLAAVSEIGSGILVQNIERLLSELVELKIRLAVASASKNAYFLLRTAGISGFFECVSDGTFRGPFKPDPDQLVDIAAQLTVSARNCVVVEDAPAGIASAKAAGMGVIGIGPAAKCYPGLKYWFGTLAHVAAEALLDPASWDTE